MASRSIRTRAAAAAAISIAGVVLAAAAQAVVVFSDDFESDVAGIRSRPGDSTASGISQSTDVPSASTGRKSLLLDTNPGESAHLLHKLAQDYGRLFYRYYVKYEATTAYHHSGGMIGGYYPPTTYPQGDAGLKGVRANGDRLVVVNFEPMSNRLDFYNNWIDMQGGTYQGLYYGRNMIEDMNVRVPNQWTCVETMVTLNTPATATNGELALWVNGNQVAHFRPGTPNGYWDGSGNWQMNGTSPAFPGLRWRDTTSLGLNWVKVMNYDATPKVWFDDVVVATERVGCLPEPSLSLALAAGVALLAGLARVKSAQTRH